MDNQDKKELLFEISKHLVDNIFKNPERYIPENRLNELEDFKQDALLGLWEGCIDIVDIKKLGNPITYLKVCIMSKLAEAMNDPILASTDYILNAHIDIGEDIKCELEDLISEDNAPCITEIRKLYNYI